MRSIDVMHDAAFEPSRTEPRASIWRRLNMAASAALASYAGRQRERRDYARLSKMTDRELDDIGLTRGQVWEAARDLDRGLFGRF